VLKLTRRGEGYYGFFTGNKAYGSDASLPASTAVVVGFSLVSLVVLLVVSIILITVPVLLSLKRLPSNVMQPGSNSLAISAACHPSRISYAVEKAADADNNLFSPHEGPSPYTMPVQPHSPTDHGETRGNDQNSSCHSRSKALWKTVFQGALAPMSSRERLLENEGGEEDGEEPGSFGRLAQSKLRMGVVKMPPEWYDEYGQDGLVEHLSFAVEEDHPSNPVMGRMYA
jgi:hypothetical protein